MAELAGPVAADDEWEDAPVDALVDEAGAAPELPPLEVLALVAELAELALADVGTTTEDAALEDDPAAVDEALVDEAGVMEDATLVDEPAAADEALVD